MLYTRIIYNIAGTRTVYRESALLHADFHSIFSRSRRFSALEIAGTFVEKIEGDIAENFLARSLYSTCRCANKYTRVYLL